MELRFLRNDSDFFCLCMKIIGDLEGLNLANCFLKASPLPDKTQIYMYLYVF